MKHSKWKILKQEDASPSRWLPVTKDKVLLPNGEVIDYFKSEPKNVSMVIPITKDNDIVFVRQYKHGIGEVCLEFPAGRIEPGKTPEEAAVDELREETGAVVAVKDLIGLAELWTEPSKSSVRVTGFLVKNVEFSQKQKLDKTEQIEVVKIPIPEIDSLVQAGEIHASDTLALLLVARNKFPELFR